MTCPCCGTRLQTSQAVWQRQMVQAGRCASCGRVRQGGNRYYCRACAVKRAELARRRYWGGSKSVEPVKPLTPRKAVGA